MTIEAVELLANSTLHVVVHMVLARQSENAIVLSDLHRKDPELVSGLITDATRSVLKENMDTILDEWEDLLEARMGEQFLHTFFNAQATEQAILAVERAVSYIQ
jgi:hypothetical protein